LLFANEGAKVMISGRRVDKLEETVELIKKQGKEAAYIQCDVSKKDDVIDLINKTVKKYGRIDCAFNNAGIDGKKSPLIDLEENEWDEIIDINLKGTFLLMKYEIRQMLTQGFGSIVNMASVCGIIARKDRSAYNTSRHGIIGLTKSAALEYANMGIKINAIAPGSIETDIFYRSTKGNKDLEDYYAACHPIGRIGKPEEAASAALWLCSDCSSFVIGHTLFVDGGFSIQ
ncbi:MAG: SDR family oxidoreductase, partial [Spirochaetes bacterium]|nr:SDR family oxidoreductase [Spirochaetota bacterium]